MLPKLAATAMIAASALTFSPSRAVIVNSTNGYSVNVTVNPVSVVAPSTCPGGYNYNIYYAYSVSFSGTSIPSSLYTLQGNFVCGSQTLFFSLPVAGGSGNNTTSVNPWRNASDCVTATPAALGCTSYYSLSIEGPGITPQTINVPIAVGLPLNLVSFDGRVDNSAVILNWTATNEQADTKYVVERSTDAANWTTIREENATNADGVTSTYYFTDKVPAAGLNYYRIREQSGAAAPRYSRIIAVKANATASDVSIVPNPSADGHVSIKGLDLTKDQWKLNICDATGRRLYATALTNSEVALPALSSGIYYFQLVNASGTERASIKWMKQ